MESTMVIVICPNHDEESLIEELYLFAHNVLVYLRRESDGYVVLGGERPPRVQHRFRIKGNTIWVSVGSYPFIEQVLTSRHIPFTSDTVTFESAAEAEQTFLDFMPS